MDDNRVYFDIPNLPATVSFDLDESYKNINDMTEEEKKDIAEKVTLIMQSKAIMITEEEFNQLTEKYSSK